MNMTTFLARVLATCALVALAACGGEETTTNPPPDTTAPTVPAGLTATGSTMSTITLAWTASTDAGGSGVHEYLVRRNGTLVAVVTTTSHTDSGLAAGSTYSYTVAARDNADNTSVDCAPLTASTLAAADTTAPSVPAGLTATATTSSTVALSWTASTDNAGGSGVKEYVVQRNGTQIEVVTTTSFVDSGLTANTAYSYAVAARDFSGNSSAFSAAQQATTPATADTTAPSVPTGLVATPSATAVALQWSASTDTGGAGLKDYLVRRDGVQIAVVAAPAITYNDAGRAPGTYSYTVAARDNANNPSAFSAAVSATVATPDTVAPSVPTGLSATPSGTAVALQWSASSDMGGSGLKEYVVRRNGVEIALVTAPTVTYNDTGRAPGTYSYTIAARDNANNRSAFSTAVSATVTGTDTTPPSVPNGLAATASGTTVALQWSASTDTGSSGLKEYVVRRNGTQIAVVTAPTVVYNDTGRPPGTYSYDVAARDNASNLSNFSAAVSATVTATTTGLDARLPNTSCVAPARPTSTTGVTLTRVFPDLTFNEPVGLVQAPGDNSRWFVVERAGLIRTFPNTPGATSADVTVFLDLRARITSYAFGSGGEVEAGLLGLAFHPQYATNGKFYAYYSGDKSIDPPDDSDGYRWGNRVSEFTSPNRISASATSERLLFRAYKLHPNHNGGQLAFGPDGYLYAGLGDGGGSDDPDGNGQNRNNLFAKILRIDVDNGSPYGIPAGNPYAANSRCSVSYTPPRSSAPRTTPCPEIYAYGLRNPWRFSFDRAMSSPDMWVADVGQGGFEEIDRITTPGGNYGWNIREGSVCRGGGTNCPTESNGAPLVPPVQDVPRDESSAIIGGFVYRGSAMTGMQGQYLYADFSTGRVYALTSNGIGGYASRLIASGSRPISTFGQDANGEIYVVDFGGGGIYRLSQAGGGTSTIPNNLSATGCVVASNPSQPASGMVPYAPNAPFWSDGAVKDRWIGLPDGQSITIGGDGDWIFPNGTVLMKNFRLNNLLVETRLFMRHPDGEWAGYTYQWNTAQTDATRVEGGATATWGTQQWIYPSEAECLQCHTSAAGGSLSPETGQLNGDFLYSSTGRTANQITTLKHIGFLSSSTPDPSTLARLPTPLDAATGTLNERARAWLHTNCSSCHRPGGGTNVSMDLRYTTSMANTATCNALPSNGDLGIAGARRLLPGDPAHSLIYLRLNRRDAQQMPPIGSNRVDTEGAALIESWILQNAGC
jgi:uncharacterized repeat protein (TIGR03806 family)